MALIIFGDFTRLRSLAASLRADALIAEGIEVEWRAVAHRPSITVLAEPRSDAASTELSTAQEQWRKAALHGEPVGVAAPPFLPAAAPPVSAYAEAAGAGVADHVRYLLFSAYWREHQDIGNPDVLRHLLAVPMLHGNSPADVHREYGYAVAIGGCPITSDGWRRMRSWQHAWESLGHSDLPAVVDGDEIFFGEQALRHLGELGQQPHTFPEANPYPLPQMPVAARRNDRFRPGLRPIWQDGESRH